MIARLGPSGIEASHHQLLQLTGPRGLLLAAMRGVKAGGQAGCNGFGRQLASRPTPDAGPGWPGSVLEGDAEGAST